MEAYELSTSSPELCLLRQRPASSLVEARQSATLRDEFPGSDPGWAVTGESPELRMAQGVAASRVRPRWRFWGFRSPAARALPLDLLFETRARSGARARPGPDAGDDPQG